MLSLQFLIAKKMKNQPFYSKQTYRFYLISTYSFSCLQQARGELIYILMLRTHLVCCDFPQMKNTTSGDESSQKYAYCVTLVI